MFRLNFRPRFMRKYGKLIKRSKGLEQRMDNVLALLSQNPRDPSLKSHKVRDRDGRPAFSSGVTGDLRIIWDYSDEHADMLDLLDIGGHEGGRKVYR